jgi:sorting nexin-8
MMNALSRMKRLIDQQAARAKNQSRDLSEMSGILKLVGSTGNIFDEPTFSEMANNVQQVSVLSDKYAHLQQTAISERFNVLLDVLIAHSDLCDRVEKGIQEEGKALSKMVTINKQKMKGVIRGTAVSGP